MTIVSTSWGVLVAQHLQEKTVGESLTSRGVEHFIPQIECICGHRRLRELRPLLGDYIPFAVDSSWKSLLRLRGIKGLLLNESGFPAQVLLKEMNRLHEMCPNGLYHSIDLIDDAGFKYGQQVTPRGGPFSGCIGNYDSKTKRGDIALFLLFGKEQKLTFKNGDLLAVA